jgi:hypothetical protein
VAIYKKRSKFFQNFKKIQNFHKISKLSKISKLKKKIQNDKIFKKLS